MRVSSWVIGSVFLSGLLMAGFVVGDIVKLNGNFSNDNAVVLLYGRRAGVCNAKVSRGKFLVDVGNIEKSDAGCRSDMVVFSVDNSLSLTEGIKDWKNSAGDQVGVLLGPRREIPVEIRVLGGAFEQREKIIEADLTRANQVYNESNCGFRFRPDKIEDLTAASEAEPHLAELDDCSLLQEFADRNWIRKDALNVFYMNMIGARGLWCKRFNAVLIAVTADGETLAHELGHSLLGEDHVGKVLGDENIMSDSRGRNLITEGQCFRANFQGSSRLVQLLGGTTRNCPKVDGSKNPRCPRLSFDVN